MLQPFSLKHEVLGRQHDQAKDICIDGNDRDCEFWLLTRCDNTGPADRSVEFDRSPAKAGLQRSLYAAIRSNAGEADSAISYLLRQQAD